MPDLIVPGPVDEERCVREAVCIHTKRVTDSCRDKDCLDCLRVYPTRSSQTVLDRAMSVKAGCAQLLCAYIDVEPVSFNRGFYAVDVRYCYRITADAFAGAGRPVEITGLAVFDKRVILYGGEGGAKVFTSSAPCHLGCPGAPEAVVDTVAYKLLPRIWLKFCRKNHNRKQLKWVTLDGESSEKGRAVCEGVHTANINDARKALETQACPGIGHVRVSPLLLQTVKKQENK